MRRFADGLPARIATECGREARVEHIQRYGCDTGKPRVEHVQRYACDTGNAWGTCKLTFDSKRTRKHGRHAEKKRTEQISK